MSTTIHVGAMPAVLSNLVGAAVGETVQPSGGLGFLDLVAREVGGKGSGETGFERSQLDLQQYKKYISGRISAIPVDPSRALDSLAVQISDAGFAAMKEDPEYEAWVLERLETEWSVPKAAGLYGGYSTYSIGADADSFRVDTVDLQSELDALEKLEALDDEKETFWERRHRHHEEYMALIQREAFLRKLRNGTLSTAELLLGGVGGSVGSAGGLF